MIPAIASLQARLRDCRGVLVDSNVLLDVATNDPAWGDWFARALAQAAEYTTLIINPIIHAEVSIGYTPLSSAPRNRLAEHPRFAFQELRLPRLRSGPHSTGSNREANESI